MADWNGFYPEHGCKRCGKPLQGEGTGYPAELYAGTYNGLCYPCTSEGIYEMNYCLVSGAKVWNHPPHCPAWRRDREIFYAFDDCEDPKCNHGRINISRSDALGGSYGKQCEKCWDRHMAHPLVKAHTYKQNLSLWRHVIATQRAGLYFDTQAEGKTDEEMKPLYRVLVEQVRAVANGADIPEEWPALKAPLRKKLLKRAPRGLTDLDIASTLGRLAGNPRKRSKA